MSKRILIAGTCALVAAAGAARATTLAPIDFNELAVTAEAVVYARVTAITPVLTEQHRIESIVTAEALGYMKGGLGRTVSFRIPGGQIGAFRTVMVGAPTFAEGDEVVLFLRTRGPALPYLVGFSQGVYRVIGDARTGARVVIPPPAINTGVTEKIQRGTRQPLSLEAFAARVRDLNGGPAAGRRQER